MNKRMQKKVAKRNGGSVRQHSVATPRRKAAGVSAQHRSGPRAAGTSEGEGPGAMARALAREVAGLVQERTADAVEQLKDKLVATEQRAEQLIAKVPGVGPKVAKKLHDVVGR